MSVADAITKLSIGKRIDNALRSKHIPCELRGFDLLVKSSSPKEPIVLGYKIYDRDISSVKGMDVVQYVRDTEH